MNVLQAKILDEISHLDMKSLIILQNILPSLKNIELKKHKDIGVGAQLSTNALSNLPNDLSKEIIEDREDRL